MKVLPSPSQSSPAAATITMADLVDIVRRLEPLRRPVSVLEWTTSPELIGYLSDPFGPARSRAMFVL